MSLLRRDFLKLGVGLALGLPFIDSPLVGYAHPNSPIYIAPSLDSMLVGQTVGAQHVAPLPMMTIEGNWIKVPQGFIPIEWVRLFQWQASLTIDAFPTPVVVIPSHVALRRWAMPNAPLLAQLPQGTPLTAIHHLDAKWIQTTWEGQTGWIQAAHLGNLIPKTHEDAHLFT